MSDEELKPQTEDEFKDVKKDSNDLIESDIKKKTICEKNQNEALPGVNQAMSLPLTNDSTDKSNKQLSDTVRATGVYAVKWIEFLNDKIPIILQNENGPCPLLAIANILLLRKQIELKVSLEFISGDKLLEYLG